MKASPGTAIALVLWIASSGSAAAEPLEVTMNNRLKFEPAQLTIQAGETVVWRNDSLLVHTVTADPDEAARAASVELPEDAAPFASGNLEPGATFRHTFETPGLYRYFCTPHEGAKMTGEIQVRP